MDNQSRNVVKRVLHDAGEHERFFDYSDAERLVWMIERAFELGRKSSDSPAKRQRRRSPTKEMRVFPQRAAAARNLISNRHVFVRHE